MLEAAEMVVIGEVSYPRPVYTHQVRTRTEQLSSTDVLMLLLATRRLPMVRRSPELDPVQMVGLIAEANWNVSYLLLRDHLATHDYYVRRLSAYRLPTLPALVVLEGRFERRNVGALLVYVECAGRHATAASLNDDVLIVVGGDVFSLSASAPRQGLLARSSFDLGVKSLEVRVSS